MALAQKIVTTLIDKYLRQYLEGLDSNALIIHLKKGDITLNNLRLKSEAIDGLSVPISLSFGYVGRLVVKVPWAHLSSEPVIAEVEEVLLVLIPRKARVWNETLENERRQALKQQRLDAWEMLESGMEDERKKAGGSIKNNLISKIINNAVNNIQIIVRNVHIRYEDDTGETDKPFVMGATLEEVSVRSTDANWESHFFREVQKSVFKLALLRNLSVYINPIESHQTLFSRSKTVNLEELKRDMLGMIPTQNRFRSTEYVLSSLNGKLELKFKPDNNTDNNEPKIDANLVVENVPLSITTHQYRSILHVVNYVLPFSRLERFRRFRPTVRPKQDPRAWWKFAIQSVLTSVRDQRPANIMDIFRKKKTQRTYILLHKRRVGVSWLPPLDKDGNAEYQQIEEQLSYEEIILYRKIAAEEIKIQSSNLQTQKQQQLRGRHNKSRGSISSTSSATSNPSSPLTGAPEPEKKKKFSLVPKLPSKKKKSESEKLSRQSSLQSLESMSSTSSPPDSARSEPKSPATEDETPDSLSLSNEMSLEEQAKSALEKKAKKNSLGSRLGQLFKNNSKKKKDKKEEEATTLEKKEKKKLKFGKRSKLKNATASRQIEDNVVITPEQREQLDSQLFGTSAEGDVSETSDSETDSFSDAGGVSAEGLPSRSGLSDRETSSELISDTESAFSDEDDDDVKTSASTETENIFETYSKIKLHAQIVGGSLEIADSTNERQDTLAVVQFKDVMADVDLNPDSFCVKAALSDFTVVDKYNEKSCFNQIVRRQASSENQQPVSPSSTSSSSSSSSLSQVQHLVTIAVEKKKDSTSFDVALNVAPLDIVFNVQLIKKLLAFAIPPMNVNVSVIQEAAIRQFMSWTDMAQKQLQIALAARKSIQLKIDVDAPSVLIPEDCNNEESPLMVLDLGRLSIHSATDLERRKQHLKANKLVESDFYDLYKLSLSNVQVLLTTNKTQWRSRVIQTNQDLHLVKQFTVGLNFWHCLTPRNEKLARFKADGRLESITVCVSPAKISKLLKLGLVVKDIAAPPDERLISGTLSIKNIKGAEIWKAVHEDESGHRVIEDYRPNTASYNEEQQQQHSNSSISKDVPNGAHIEWQNRWVEIRGTRMLIFPFDVMNQSRLTEKPEATINLASAHIRIISDKANTDGLAPGDAVLLDERTFVIELPYFNTFAMHFMFRTKTQTEKNSWAEVLRNIVLSYQKESLFKDSITTTHATESAAEEEEKQTDEEFSDEEPSPSVSKEQEFKRATTSKTQAIVAVTFSINRVALILSKTTDGTNNSSQRGNSVVSTSVPPLFQNNDFLEVKVESIVVEAQHCNFDTSASIRLQSVSASRLVPPPPNSQLPTQSFSILSSAIGPSDRFDNRQPDDNAQDVCKASFLIAKEGSSKYRTDSANTDVVAQLHRIHVVLDKATIAGLADVGFEVLAIVARIFRKQSTTYSYSAIYYRENSYMANMQKIIEQAAAQLTASMSEVSLTLVDDIANYSTGPDSDGSKFLTAALSALRLSVSKSASTLKIDASLGNFSVVDHSNPDSLYKEIIGRASSMGGGVLSSADNASNGDGDVAARITLVQQIASGYKHNRNPTYTRSWDLFVNSIQFVYVTKFLMNIRQYVFAGPIPDSLISGVQKIWDIAAEYKRLAKDMTVRISQSAEMNEVKLRILSPLIVVPVSCTSKELFVVNLGEIAFTNSIRILEFKGVNNFLEKYEFAIHDIKLRAFTATDGETHIVDGMNVDMLIYRDVQIYTATHVPLFKISAKYSGLTVRFSQYQYNMIMSTLTNVLRDVNDGIHDLLEMEHNLIALGAKIKQETAHNKQGSLTTVEATASNRLRLQTAEASLSGSSSDQGHEKKAPSSAEGTDQTQSKKFLPRGYSRNTIEFDFEFPYLKISLMRGRGVTEEDTIVAVAVRKMAVQLMIGNDVSIRAKITVNSLGVLDYRRDAKNCFREIVNCNLSDDSSEPNLAADSPTSNPFARYEALPLSEIFSQQFQMFDSGFEEQSLLASYNRTPNNEHQLHVDINDIRVHVVPSYILDLIRFFVAFFDKTVIDMLLRLTNDFKNKITTKLIPAVMPLLAPAPVSDTNPRQRSASENARKRQSLTAQIRKNSSRGSVIGSSQRPIAPSSSPSLADRPKSKKQGKISICAQFGNPELIIPEDPTNPNSKLLFIAVGVRRSSDWGHTASSMRKRRLTTVTSRACNEFVFTRDFVTKEEHMHFQLFNMRISMLQPELFAPSQADSSEPKDSPKEVEVQNVASSSSSSNKPSISHRKVRWIDDTAQSDARRSGEWIIVEKPILEPVSFTVNLKGEDQLGIDEAGNLILENSLSDEPEAVAYKRTFSLDLEKDIRAAVSYRDFLTLYKVAIQFLPEKVKSATKQRNSSDTSTESMENSNLSNPTSSAPTESSSSSSSSSTAPSSSSPSPPPPPRSSSQGSGSGNPLAALDFLRRYQFEANVSAKLVRLIVVDDYLGHDIPLLDVQLFDSNFHGSLRELLDNVEAEASVKLRANYFNLKIAEWEPILEDWEFKAEARRGQNSENSAAAAAADSESEAQHEAASVTESVHSQFSNQVMLYSSSQLNVNVTHALVSTFSNTACNWRLGILEVTSKVKPSRPTSTMIRVPPYLLHPAVNTQSDSNSNHIVKNYHLYVIRNHTGRTLTFWKQHQREGETQHVVSLESGEEASFDFEDPDATRTHDLFGIVDNAWSRERLVHISIGTTFPISVNRVSRVSVPLAPLSASVPPDPTNTIHVEVELQNAKKIVTLRSLYKILNNTNIPVVVAIALDQQQNNIHVLSTLMPHESIAVPLQFITNGILCVKPAVSEDVPTEFGNQRFQFSPIHPDNSIQSLVKRSTNTPRNRTTQRDLNETKMSVLCCDAVASQDQAPDGRCYFVLHTHSTQSKVRDETTTQRQKITVTDFCFELQSPMALSNLLGYSLKYALFPSGDNEGRARPICQGTIARGSKLFLHSVDLEKDVFLEISPIVSTADTWTATSASPRRWRQSPQLVLIHCGSGSRRNTHLANEIELVDQSTTEAGALHLKLDHIFWQRGTKSASSVHAFREIEMFCAFWLVNHTGLKLTARHALPGGKNRLCAGQDRHSLQGYCFFESQTEESERGEIESRSSQVYEIGPELSPHVLMLSHKFGNQISVGVENSSQFSASFAIDKIRSNGVITVDTMFSGSPQRFHLATRVEVGNGKYSQTKIVTVSPRFVVVNQISSCRISLKQFGQTTASTSNKPPSAAIVEIQGLQQGKSSPFFWTSSGLSAAARTNTNNGKLEFPHLCLRIDERDDLDWSRPFHVLPTGEVTLKLMTKKQSDFIGPSQQEGPSADTAPRQSDITIPADCDGTSAPDPMFVRVRFTERKGVIFIVFDDCNGLPPYRIENNTAEDVRICQNGSNLWWEVAHNGSLDYAWDEPQQQLAENGGNSERFMIVQIDDIRERIDIDKIGGQQQQQNRRQMSSSHRNANGGVWWEKFFMVNSHNGGQKRVRLTLCLLRTVRILTLENASTQSLEPLHKTASLFQGHTGLCVEFICSLSGIGLSLVDKVPREICCVSIVGIRAFGSVSNQMQHFEAQIERAQVDNQLLDANFPVIFAPTEPFDGRPFVSTMVTRSGPILPPLLIGGSHRLHSSSVSLVERIQQEISVQFIDELTVKLRQCTARLDYGYLMLLLEYIDSLDLQELLGKANNTRTTSLIRQPKVDELPLAATTSPLSPVDKLKFYLSLFKIHSVRMNLTFVNNLKFDEADDEMRVIGADSESDDEMRKAFKRTIYHKHRFELLPIDKMVAMLDAVMINPLGAALANVDNAPIHLGSLQMQNNATFFTVNGLVDMSVRHYTHAVLGELHKILGSLEVIGNPVGFFYDIGTGIHAFFNEPVKAMSESPLNLGKGIVKGTSSLIKKSIHGTFNSQAKIAESLGKGVEMMSFDDEYIRSRGRQKIQRARPKHVGQGIKSGMGALGKGVLSGATGIVTSPIEGASHSGFGGFVKGIGKGVIGIGVKPLAGALELASRTHEGIKNTTSFFDHDSFDWTDRMREPHVFSPRGSKLLPLSEAQARLRRIKSGRFSEQHTLFYAGVNSSLSPGTFEFDHIIFVTEKNLLLVRTEDNELTMQLSLSEIKHMECDKLGIVINKPTDKQKKHKSHAIQFLSQQRAQLVERQLRDVLARLGVELDEAAEASNSPVSPPSAGGSSSSEQE